LASHKDNTYCHKITIVSWIPNSHILWRSWVPICDEINTIVIYSLDYPNFMTLCTLVSYYETLCDDISPGLEHYYHRRLLFL
jgi:hypothetical protein